MMTTEPAPCRHSFKYTRGKNNHKSLRLIEDHVYLHNPRGVGYLIDNMDHIPYGGFRSPWLDGIFQIDYHWNKRELG